MGQGSVDGGDLGDEISKDSCLDLEARAARPLPIHCAIPVLLVLPSPSGGISNSPHILFLFSHFFPFSTSNTKRKRELFRLLLPFHPSSTIGIRTSSPRAVIDPLWQSSTKLIRLQQPAEHGLRNSCPRLGDAPRDARGRVS